jgi:hypothetical protein
LVEYSQAPLLLSTAVTAIPVDADASTSVDEISAETSVPALPVTSSLIAVRLFAAVTTGASFTAVTVMPAVSVAALKVPSSPLGLFANATLMYSRLNQPPGVSSPRNPVSLPSTIRRKRVFAAAYWSTLKLTVDVPDASTSERMEVPVNPLPVTSSVTLPVLLRAFV